MLLNIIIATGLISLSVFVALLFFYLNSKQLSKITIFLVSLSAGAFMGGAFLHLLPEAAEQIKSNYLFGTVLASFVFFFLLEKLLHWRHCHKANCEIHSFGYINLVGDSIHNFIDGLVIASAFLINIPLGIATTIAIALHEVPQEIGDFGVLIHAGFNKKKALLVNYIVALAVVAGGIVGYFLANEMENIIPYLLPFAAGGFIYIAASDLMPELRKEKSLKKSMLSFLVFIAGILLMAVVR